MSAYTKVRMRDDLAKEGYSVPASFTFSNYDTQDDPIMYLTAKDLEGATEFCNGVDSDSHPFIVVKLANGEVVYMVGADLDWGEECKYCGGNCPSDEAHACDGYLGDIDNLYGEEV